MLSDMEILPDYNWDDTKNIPSHEYILPMVFDIIDGLALKGRERRIFDLGCGNGSVGALLSEKDYDITGIDPSKEGLEQAKKAYPDLKLFRGSVYDDLASHFEKFPVVISLEVIEHIYYPRKFAACVHSLLCDGGVAVISTPYHGYWKNLALALSGKMDAHFTALWDHGHIKFWSFKTLRQLLEEAGFKSVEFNCVGRISCLAKSIIAVARK